MICKPKRTVIEAIKNNGKWTGFLAANKNCPAHINGPWCLGMKVTFTSLEELEVTS